MSPFSKQRTTPKLWSQNEPANNETTQQSTIIMLRGQKLGRPVTNHESISPGLEPPPDAPIMWAPLGDEGDALL